MAGFGRGRGSQAPEPPAPAPPPPPPKLEDVLAKAAHFWGGGRGRRPDLADVVAASRGLSALERRSVHDSVPYGTGDTGRRCDALRAALARELEG